MKIINDLKKYVWVIIVIAMVALNGYNIRSNMLQSNRNEEATICLASGVGVLADATTKFIKTYIDDRRVVNTKVDVLSTRELDNKANIILNAEDIVKNQSQIIRNMNTLEKMSEKPTYKYLKSVTVFIVGEVISKPRLPQREESIDENKIPDVVEDKPLGQQWCGTGIIVKQDAENTYILTNRHVAGGYTGEPVKIQIRHNAKFILTEVIKLHKSQDLALLKMKGSLKGKSVVRGLAYPNITEKVYTVGHSLGRPFMYGEGIYSGTIIDHDIYQLPVIGGQSGSGVFNSKGEVLGLVYSLSGSNTGYDNTRANVIKGYYVKKFLEEIM